MLKMAITNKTTAYVVKNLLLLFILIPHSFVCLIISTTIASMHFIKLLCYIKSVNVAKGINIILTQKVYFKKHKSKNLSLCYKFVIKSNKLPLPCINKIRGVAFVDVDIKP